MPARYARLAGGAGGGWATMLSPPQPASYPAWSASRAIVQHVSTGGRRADSITTARVGTSTPMRITSAALYRSVLRKAEHALADDVALDLASPAGDRVLAGARHPGRPAPRVRRGV